MSSPTIAGREPAVDSSALLKRYIDEPDSATASALLASYPSLNKASKSRSRS
jgi:hypothetical protein